jgi:hypothetical protein
MWDKEKPMRQKPVWRFASRLFWSWSVLFTVIPALAAACLWYGTSSNPVSAYWMDVSVTAPPTSKAGTYLKIIQKWILVQDGEVWCLRDSQVRRQLPPPQDIPLGSTYESPMSKWPGVGSFGQYSARKYWGVGSQFAGFTFNFERRPDTDPMYFYTRSFFSLPLWVFYIPLFLVLARRTYFCTKRQPHGICSCGYDLRAHRPGQNCPECGTPIPAQPATIPHERSRP